MLLEMINSVFMTAAAGEKDGRGTLWRIQRQQMYFGTERTGQRNQQLLFRTAVADMQIIGVIRLFIDQFVLRGFAAQLVIPDLIRQQRFFI